MRVLFSGYFGGGNLGDEAILAAELLGFGGVLGTAFTPAVATVDAALTRRLHGEIETVPFWDVRELARAVAACDLVIWGGGGLLQDHWVVPPEELFLDPTGGIPAYVRVPLLAHILGRPFMVYGQGIGPLNRPESRKLVEIVLNQAAAITVRDMGSADLLRGCGVTVCPVLTSADPVVSLTPSSPERGREILAAAGIDPARRPIVAIAPRVPPGGDRSWITPFVEGLDAFRKETGASAIFVPFDWGDPGDDGLCRELAAACSKAQPVGVAATWLSPSDVAACLSQCDLTVATRLHGLYLSVLSGTPVVALDYDPKIRAAAREFHPDIPVLPLSRLDARSLEHELETCLTRGPGTRPRLLAVLEGLRSRESLNLATAVELVAKNQWTRTPKPGFDSVREHVELMRLRLENGRLAAALRPVQEAAAAALLEADTSRRAMTGMWARLNREKVHLEEEIHALHAAKQKAEAESRVARQERDAFEQDFQKLRTAFQTAGSEAHAVRTQRDVLIEEKALLERDLGILKSSRGIRAILAYWSLANRYFPKGGRLNWLRGLVHGDKKEAPSEPPKTETAPLFSSSDRPASTVPMTPYQPRDVIAEFESFLSGPEMSGKAGIVILVSGTTLDINEGQRPAQLALHLAQLGHIAVFGYFRWSEQDWCPQNLLDRGIFQIPMDLLIKNAPRFLGEKRFTKKTLLFSFPHPRLFEFLAMARSEGWTTVYDVMDDWREFSRAGQAVWYDEDFEKHLLGSADVIAVVNSHLARHIETLSPCSAVVIPNGVSLAVSDVDEERVLERGDVTVGYFGYLAGAWFDWDLVIEAAEARPGWRFYLIGYGGAPADAAVPRNLRLLGKQPQRRLAGFAANWDVAMIPFKGTQLSAGADPIKLYEYLAMGLPVVATGVFPPPGAESLVTRTEGLDGFLGAIAAAAKTRDQGRENREAYARQATWESRARKLLSECENLENGRIRLLKKLLEEVP